MAERSKTVNALTQNVLLDYRRTRDGLILPQDKRIDALAATLMGFPGSLDVVGIQEAHKSKAQHNGERLAALCGYDRSFWENHNQKPVSEDPNQKPLPKNSRGRANEYMGLFGSMVDHAQAIDIGDNRLALMTEIAGVAFVTLHLRSGGWETRNLRRDQAEVLARELSSYEDAVLLGDFNEPPINLIAKARGALAREGFRSVFELTEQSHPKTSPVESYGEASANGRGWKGLVVKRGWSIDDILVRGSRVGVLGAGVLERVIIESEVMNEWAPALPRDPSDHEGLWAKLSIVD